MPCPPPSTAHHLRRCPFPVLLRRLLERNVQPYVSRPSGFSLAPEWQCPVPKWGKAMGWGPRDDAMLLMGKTEEGEEGGAS